MYRITQKKTEEKKESNDSFATKPEIKDELIDVYVKILAFTTVLNGGDIIETDIDLYSTVFPYTQTIKMIVPDSSNNLRHFLNCSGEEVQMNVKDLLSWSTYARNRYDDYILKLMQYAEDTIKIGDNLIIANRDLDTNGDGEPDGLIAYSKPSLSNNNSNLSDVLYYSDGVIDIFLDINWFSGYGECNSYLVGNISRTSEEWYEGSSKYMVFDMYDWLEDSTATLVKGVIPTDGELHKLHEAGLAREFYQSGTYTDTLNWYRQRLIY